MSLLEEAGEEADGSLCARRHDRDGLLCEAVAVRAEDVEHRPEDVLRVVGGNRGREVAVVLLHATGVHERCERISERRAGFLVRHVSSSDALRSGLLAGGRCGESVVGGVHNLELCAVRGQGVVVVLLDGDSRLLQVAVRPEESLLEVLVKEADVHAVETGSQDGVEQPHGEVPELLSVGRHLGRHREGLRVRVLAVTLLDVVEEKLGLLCGGNHEVLSGQRELVGERSVLP
jgi:hypothetical protein